MTNQFSKQLKNAISVFYTNKAGFKDYKVYCWLDFSEAK